MPTSGRKMRLTCFPTSTPTRSSRARPAPQRALTVVEQATPRPLARSALREIWPTGTVLVVGHAMRSASSVAEPLVAGDHLPDGYDDEVEDDLRPASCARRLASRRHQGRVRVRAHPQGGVGDLTLEEVPDVSYLTSAA